MYLPWLIFSSTEEQKKEFLTLKGHTKEAGKKRFFTSLFRVLNFVDFCRVSLNNVSLGDILKKIHGKFMLSFSKLMLNFPYMKQNAYYVLNVQVHSLNLTDMILR